MRNVKMLDTNLQIKNTFIDFREDPEVPRRRRRNSWDESQSPTYRASSSLGSIGEDAEGDCEHRLAALFRSRPLSSATGSQSPSRASVTSGLPDVSPSTLFGISDGSRWLSTGYPTPSQVSPLSASKVHSSLPSFPSNGKDVNSGDTESDPFHLHLQSENNNNNPLRHPNGPSKIENPTFTTLMLRNIPSRFTQAELLADLCQMGWENTLDYFYLPVNFSTCRNLGYAFLNCVSPELAYRFCTEVEGTTLPRYWTSKKLEVTPAALQGFYPTVKRFLDGPSKRISNPYFRPIIFIDGVGCPLTRDSLRHEKRRRRSPTMEMEEQNRI